MSKVLTGRKPLSTSVSFGTDNKNVMMGSMKAFTLSVRRTMKTFIVLYLSSVAPCR